MSLPGSSSLSVKPSFNGSLSMPTVLFCTKNLF